MKIRVIISGRHYHLADEMPEFFELQDGAALDAALEAVAAQLPGGQLPPSCLLVVAGKHVGSVAAHPAVTLQDGDELEIIAPVAGG